MNHRHFDAASLPEWRTPEEPAVPSAPERLAFPELDALADLLTRETDLLRAGQFDDFMKLQATKRASVRAAERLTRRHAGRAEPPDGLEKALRSVREIAAHNQELLGAMKAATASIRSYAMEAIEAGQTDGLYGRDGSAKAQKRLSTKGVHVKL